MTIKFKLIFSVCITFSLATLTFANELLDESLDKPRYKIVKTMGHSKLAEGAIVQTCYLYNDWVIKEITDPAYVGTVSLKLAAVKKSQPISAKLCNSDKLIFKTLANAYNYLGKFRDFIVTASAETFGHGQPFKVLNLKTLETIYSSTAYDLKPIKFLPNGNDVGLSYWKLLQPSCSLLNKEKEQCWQSILNANKIQITAIPKCPKNGDDQNTLDNPSMIFMEAWVKNINNPNDTEFMTHNTICLAAP